MVYPGKVCFQKWFSFLHFNSRYVLETFISDVVFLITEKKQRNKSKQLFDLIIDDL